MQEASFQGLIKMLLWGFVIYYVLKFLARLFLPVLAKKMIDKAQEQFQQQYQNQQNDAQQNATKTNPNLKSDKPREKNKVGEYIDYEEID
jgi:Domain of unknown function (DUF4834)